MHSFKVSKNYGSKLRLWNRNCRDLRFLKITAPSCGSGAVISKKILQNFLRNDGSRAATWSRNCRDLRFLKITAPSCGSGAVISQKILQNFLRNDGSRAATCPHGLGQLFMLFLANSALKCPNLCFVCATAQPLQSLHLCCVFCFRSGQSSPQSAFVRPSLMRHRPAALCFVPNFARITSFSRFVPQNQFNLVALPQCHNFGLASIHPLYSCLQKRKNR